MDTPIPTGAEAFGAALAALDAEINWELLESSYCWDEGAGFFAEEQREAMLDAGLQIASAMSEGLAKLPADGPRRSLYVGAAVAELAPMLCDALVLGREVRIVNLSSDESDELNRAFEAVGLVLRIETQVAPLEYDHLWVVSVFNDPEAFPGLHDELYQRSGELATGQGDRFAERERVNELVREWCEVLKRPALISTTDEELDFFREECSRRAWTLKVPKTAILSGIVGDPVRHCPLS